MDDLALKFLMFTGIGLVIAAGIGIFLVVLKLSLAVFPEITIMGIAMYAI